MTYVKIKEKKVETNLNKVVVKEEPFKEEKYIETHIRVNNTDYYVRFTNHQGLRKGISTIMRDYGYELSQLKIISSRTHKRVGPRFIAKGFKP